MALARTNTSGDAELPHRFATCSSDVELLSLSTRGDMTKAAVYRPSGVLEIVQIENIRAPEPEARRDSRTRPGHHRKRRRSPFVRVLINPAESSVPARRPASRGDNVCTDVCTGCRKLLRVQG
jgi:hypothetical protein